MKISIETQDIVLAAALKVLGYRLDNIEKVGNKGIFHFVDVDEYMVNDYDLGNLRVEPVAFNSAIKALTTASRRII
jgi:protein associated with RNAse G/E